MANSVVLIHGAFCGGWCFADVMPVLAAHGWNCQAPDLRFHVSGPARTPAPQLATTSVADYTRDMAELVGRLPEPPVIIGHSMGALVTQQLAAQGLARAIVLLAPGAPWGVLPTTDDELALAKGLMMASPFWDRALNPSFEVAQQDSLASLDPEAQRRVFDQFSAESGLALFELFFWMFDKNCTTAVETGKVNCPVLVVSGSEDKVISPVTGRTIAQLYRGATFHEATGRGHFLIMEEGAAQLAGRCADWMAEVTT
jgi:non-heme chloroperoxidase